MGKTRPEWLLPTWPAGSPPPTPSLSPSWPWHPSADGSPAASARRHTSPAPSAAPPRRWPCAPAGGSPGEAARAAQRTTLTLFLARQPGAPGGAPAGQQEVVIYSRNGSATSMEKASPHLVCDVIVGELHDVPCQIAHGVQRHGAVLEEMSACGKEKSFQSTVSAVGSVMLENNCRAPPATAIELKTNFFGVFFCLPCYFFAGQPLASTGWRGEQNRKTGQEEWRDRGRRHYLLTFLPEHQSAGTGGPTDQVLFIYLFFKIIMIIKW